MEIAEFTPAEARAIISWLIYLLGGRVVIPDNDQFWEENYDTFTEIYVDHDGSGNPVLVTEALQ